MSEVPQEPSPPTTLRVVGDSITYLAHRHGAEAMFAERGYTAFLDGDAGERADSPLRNTAWRAAASGGGPGSVGVYALGANDLMRETFRDPEDPAFSTSELSHLVATLTERLMYGSFWFEDVVWVNVTTRTLNGNYNRGARLLNAAMRAVCYRNGFCYADWDAKKAPTSDLIHQKIAGTPLWVDAIVESLADP